MIHGVAPQSRRRGQPLRLFVAAYPPPAVSETLLGRCTSITLPPHRLTPPEQVHMTLHFLGDVPIPELPEVEESVRRSAAGLGAFELRITRLRSLPERGPARLVAAEADEHPTLAEVHRRLVHRLAMKPRARDRFLPHFTLLRFTGGGAPVNIEQPMDPVVFEMREIVLVRSVLKPSGAEHAEVIRAPL